MRFSFCATTLDYDPGQKYFDESECLKSCQNFCKTLTKSKVSSLISMS